MKVKNGEITDEFSTLVNLCIHIPYVAICVIGIVDDMVKDSPTIEEALKDFIAFVGNSVLMGHNIKWFDLPFIQRDCKFFRSRRESSGMLALRKSEK